MEIKEMLHKSPSERSFTNGIHSLLKRADTDKVLTAFVLYLKHIASLRVRYSN